MEEGDWKKETGERRLEKGKWRRETGKRRREAQRSEVP
jgi:hypothetical protein